MVFNLESLKLQSPLGKIPMGGGGEMVKLSTYVRTKDSASKAGYLMLDLDFPQGARGWMQRAGCSFTQKGLHCGEVEVQVSANLTSVFASSSDGASLSAEFEVLEEEDAKFLEYIIYRPYKVLQEGKQGTVRMAKQEGKEAAGTVAGRRLKVSNLQSSFFHKRWPQLSASENQQDARCFLSPKLVFVDHDADLVSVASNFFA